MREGGKEERKEGRVFSLRPSICDFIVDSRHGMLGVDREGKGREGKGGVSHHWSPFLNRSVRSAEAGSHIPPSTEEVCLENFAGSLTGS